MSDSIAVQFATLEHLADELRLLGAELAAEAELCRSVTYTIGTAVDGEAGARAAELGTVWAGMVDLLAQGTGAVGESLRAAVHSYRMHEAALADRHLYAAAGVPVP